MKAGSRPNPLLGVVLNDDATGEFLNCIPLRPLVPPFQSTTSRYGSSNRVESMQEGIHLRG